MKTKMTNEEKQNKNIEILNAVEFGYRCCEKGFNLQKTMLDAENFLADATQFMSQDPYDVIVKELKARNIIP